MNVTIAKSTPSDQSNGPLIQAVQEALIKAHKVKHIKLPAFSGTSRKVMDAIHQQIGKGSLSMADIAAQLCMSKRTLLRKLNEQHTNFFQLRDLVRLYYAIALLADSDKSLDQIAKHLDFSGRASFTIAFKRWNTITPAGFRKAIHEDLEPFKSVI